MQPDSFLAERQKMVHRQVAARGLKDARVLDAMTRVPRHEFVPEKYRSQAYEDHPLPIEEGQTISQPYIVAVTVAALKLSPSSKVLEIGTGSGYQTALLCELSGQVFSMERHKELAESAKSILECLGYRNVAVLVGDGGQGLAEHSPYDAIVVSAAAAQIPRPLLDQLKDGARIVIPVGSIELQQLQLVIKEKEQLHIETLENCRFVPLVSD
jgi:protein-L-isoaspartate(D-aspartate) O-methyltransferase